MAPSRVRPRRRNLESGCHAGTWLDRRCFEELEEAWFELKFFGDATHGESVADLDVGKRPRVGCGLVGGTWNRIAVRAGRGVTKKFVHRHFDRIANDVLPAAGFVMRFGPGQLEYVGQKSFGQTVAADDLFGQTHARRCEHDCLVGGDEAFGLEPLHHFAHRRAADLQPFGNARLDDVDVILLELKDALAVLLERWMMFARTGHDVKYTELSWARLDELTG